MDDDQGPSESKRRRRRSRFILDVVNCFAGGVFLATSLLHMLPDVRRDIGTAQRAVHAAADAAVPVYAEFPMAEFITCIGFFVVLLLEEVIDSLIAIIIIIMV